MAQYEVVVVGAGVFGSWTAWHLARAGKSVLLLDALGPGHARSSSGGESRILRMGYGPDAIYTNMAWRSLTLWRELIGPLFHRTGVLWLAREGDPYSNATRRTLESASVPIEILAAREIAKRYPQIQLSSRHDHAIFEPEAGALLARRAVAAVVEDAVSQGVEYALEAVESPTGSGSLPSLRTLSGNSIRATTFVFACGPWLPKLFPALLGDRIRPSRQEVFFFSPPPGDPRFAPPQLPVWIDFTEPRGPYGFPDLESRGCKLAFDRHGPPFDPDNGDRRIFDAGVREARAFLAERFPALSQAPLTEFRVCQYENTSNGDFLIDRHPDFENVWLAGGSSGHGFKHGPAVGEYLSARILSGGPVDPRFSLESKGRSENRTVY
ncbi:MAG TPA: FAD-dependent oxidoreductase [Bryobacteraceae bacterium]|nr:FAD-dependent oxidoreductase [Bryobacteraceae bacterium]